MQVFKFGGASIKDVNAVINVGSIIKNHGQKPLVIIVSAMGKTTRALEGLLANKNDTSFEQKWNEIKSFHFDIMRGLFPSKHPVYVEINTRFTELAQLNYTSTEAVLLHALVVSYGEIFSSIIITNYLNQIGEKTQWLYAPDVIITSKLYSEGEVDWKKSKERINKALPSVLAEKIILTQGYIASCAEGVITLGKEGSDYTAAIFGALLGANKVTIWKDVTGILNADPKEIKNAKQFLELPYSEASEMTYYGASVIHPKTIKPLATHKIPLIVRSFDNPESTPTIITDKGLKDLEPSIIYKRNQCLFSFKVTDYTFVNEVNLAAIFKVLHDLNLPINMMQNSAISISVCFTYSKSKVDKLLSTLNTTFEMYYNTGLKLITIKNYTPFALSEYTPPKATILMEQRTRSNYRALVKD
ncbi:MAG: aspartate kinase [Cyclobacteriaceae bacterium]|nr:aspartate kinase [Cyclobacteriaceae bacterium]